MAATTLTSSSTVLGIFLGPGARVAGRGGALRELERARRGTDAQHRRALMAFFGASEFSENRQQTFVPMTSGRPRGPRRRRGPLSVVAKRSRCRRRGWKAEEEKREEGRKNFERFISRGQKALAHPSLLPLSNALALRQPTPLLATLITVTIETYHTPSPQTVTHAHCRSYNPACHDSHTYLFRNGTRAVTRNTGCRRPER